MKKSILGILSLVLALSACNNDLEINAPWQDVSVVYGILNQGDDTNWVRIHRTYLGTEGINGGSQSADSLYYNNLNVSIQELDNNGSVRNTWMLTRDNSRQLDSGFFTTDGFHLYRLDNAIDPAYTYRLLVDKPDGDGEQVTASTPIVEAFSITKPVGQQKLTFGKNGQEFKWDAAKEARIYQAYLRFYYVEINAFDKGDSVREFVDYKLPTKLGTNLNGKGDIIETVSYETFYRYLYNSIGEKEDVIRFFRKMDIYVTAGADDLATYISVSQPAEGIVQDKPLYTNVNNGIGIFSSIGDADKLGMALSIPSVDSLVKGIYTCELMFAKASAGDTCTCLVPGQFDCK